TPSAMATYNYSFQMYLPRAAFLKSMVFSVGICRFIVRGVVYSYQTMYLDAMEQLTWILTILAISSLETHLNSLQLLVCDSLMLICVSMNLLVNINSLI